MEPDSKLRAALEPAWNDLREHRLLGRLVESRRQRAARRRPLVASALALACAAIVFALWHSTIGSIAPSHAGAVASTAPAVDAIAAGYSSRMTLADGSEAQLGPEGNVQVEEQAPARVRLRQRAGAARYVVRPDPAREFVVVAEGVSVRVRGTIFSVVIGSDAVDVSVERGRVEVSDGARTRDLVVGEAFHIPLHPAADDASSAVAAPPAPPAASPSVASAASIASAPSPAALLAHADEARASGNPAEAARALETFATFYPRESRLPAALFTLGRVERARGRPDSAASAFDRCASAMPAGPLADDALAEAAQSWNAAGAVDRARADANAYLSAHPGGLHAAAMRALVAR
jgi:transmembrane sensor